MPSIDPNTFAPRYVDLNKAMQDGKVTKREVNKYIVPHYRDAWSDSQYFQVLSELSTGFAMVGTERIRATRGAKELLGLVLAWE